MLLSGWLSRVLADEGLGIVLSLVAMFILLLSKFRFLLTRLHLSYKGKCTCPFRIGFNNGLRTQRKPCLFLGVDIQGPMKVNFFELKFQPFVQAAAVQLQHVHQPLLIPVELEVHLSLGRRLS